MWLKVDVGLSRILRRRTALPTPRAPALDGLCRWLCQVPRRPRTGFIPYGPYLVGEFVMAVPPLLLELLYARDITQDLHFFPGNVETTEMDDVERCSASRSQISVSVTHR